ncbi:hypothetical protein DI392_15975 [Vibrio albus]|uniref:Uncharacterized protein n=1 Tax=Vibrio albus TaxID=2200953 RepID=A0A2U3B5V1_9VIBR|nr:tetratricopeptide repeat protein [Vibrio albus]PWI32178.1 hypothetical protein DI392_15975 [Vibrio albus]
MEVKEARIHSANNGRNALQRATGTSYDIIIASEVIDKNWSAKLLFEELTYGNLLRKDAVFVVWAKADKPDTIRDVQDTGIDGMVVAAWGVTEIRQSICSLLKCKQALSELYRSDDESPLEETDSTSMLSLCNQLEFTYPDYFYSIQKFRGELFEKASDYDAAVRLYRSMLNHLSANDDTDWLYLRLSNALIENGQFKQARKTLQEYRLRCERYSVTALDIEAKLELNLGKIEKAVDILFHACRLIPDNYARQELLAALYLIQQKYEQSQKVYQYCYRAVKNTFRDSPPTYFRYLRSLLYVAQSDDALSYMYRKKFELEIKRWKGGAVLCKKEMLQFNLLKMHSKSLSGERTVVISKLKQLCPELRQMNMDSLQHYLFLAGSYRLDKEMEEAYAVASAQCQKATANSLVQVEPYLISHTYRCFQEQAKPDAGTDYLPVTI